MSDSEEEKLNRAHVCGHLSVGVSGGSIERKNRNI